MQLVKFETMKRFSAALLLFCVWCRSSDAADANNTTYDLEDRPLTKPCRVSLVVDKDGKAHSWMCEVDPGDYHGEVGHSLVIEGLDIEDDKSIVSGETWMFADGATIVGHTIEIPTNELPSFQTSETPSLEMKTKTTGVRTMLAVLIETDDYKAPMTAAQLKNQLWFDPVSLYKQYKACSFDQLVFDPTLLAYPLGGVVRVVLDGKKAEGQSHDTVSNWATTWMNSQPWLTVGNRHWYDNSDHILFFLPHAPVAGLAEVNGKLSWFGNDGAAWYSNTIHQHEIGHNIQLHHASHGAEEYGDESGLMGFTSYVSGAVDQDYRLCFNGAKSWQLGWYDDGNKELMPPYNNDQQYFNVVGIADYNYRGSNNVIIKINGGGRNDPLYIAFNRASRFNSDTAEGANRVMVTQQEEGIGKMSHLKAILGTGQDATFRLTIARGEATIKIQVESITLESDLPMARVRIRKTFETRCLVRIFGMRLFCVPICGFIFGEC